MTPDLRGAVAILGWGSLLWEPAELAPRMRGPWALGAGPSLPLEFSRVSRKRRGALTLVIDPVHGVACRTHAVASVRAGVAEAAEDLAAREQAPVGMIGRVCLRAGAARGAQAEAVAAWCEAVGAAGAVWTDLPANFVQVAGRPFSPAAACDWLRALPGAALAGAVAYVERAPPESDTPLRRALAADPWWRALAGGAARP